MHPEMAPAKGEVKKAAPKIVFTEAELKSMTIIYIKEPFSLEVLAQDLDIEKRLLEKWNPDYELFIMDLYPEKEYKFRIPKDKVDSFMEKKPILAKKSEKYFKDMLL
jgi:hypothetical protein